jgi:uncharacterized membrane protein
MFNKANVLPKSLRFLLIIVLVLGILFRLVNLDRKVYWHDEVFTSLTISGYTRSEVDSNIENGSIITPQDLQKYQYPSPNKSFSSSIYSLAIDEPQLSPLYFCIVKLWVNLFGNSITVIRSISVIFSLLSLPCIYWLCLELFQSSSIAWIGTAILGVSPLHILYAQEARMYSLYALIILLSSLAFLRAIRLGNKLSWALYAATITIGMYTHLLFGLVSAAHGSYILISQKPKINKTSLFYLIASLIGLITFIPWLVVMIIRYPYINSQLDWLNQSKSLFKIVFIWLVNFSRILFDFQADYILDNLSDYILWFFVLGLSLALLVYSIYFLYRRSSKEQYQLILFLIFIPAIALTVPDLLSGGTRSIHTRYALITYLGCNLAFAYLFGTQIIENNNSRLKKNVWNILLMTLIFLGLVSCSLSYNKYTWWNKFFSSDNIPISRIIEQEKSPLVISEGDTKEMGFGNLVSLSYSLNNQTKIQLFRQLDITKIPTKDFKSVFVFNPSPQFKDEMENKYGLKLENIYQNDLSLWKLKQ